MDFFKRKLAEVEGEMTTTSSPAGAASGGMDSGMTESAAKLGASSAAAAEKATAWLSSATGHLKALGTGGAFEELTMREELERKDEALNAAQQQVVELTEQLHGLRQKHQSQPRPASPSRGDTSKSMTAASPVTTAAHVAMEEKLVEWRECVRSALVAREPSGQACSEPPPLPRRVARSGWVILSCASAAS